MTLFLELIYSTLGALSIVYGLANIVPGLRTQDIRKHIILLVFMVFFVCVFSLNQLVYVVIFYGFLIFYLKWVYGISSFIASLSILFLFLIVTLSSMMTSNLNVLLFKSVVDYRVVFFYSSYKVVFIYWILYLLLLKYYQMIMRIFKKITHFNKEMERTLLLSNVIVFAFIVFNQKNTFVNLVKIISSGLVEQAENVSIGLYMNSNYMLTTILTFAVVILLNRLFIVDNNMESYKVKAETDLMTGALNREAGLNFLKESMMNSIVQSYDLTVAYIDINDLKLVNDKYGHKEGDLLIKKITEIIETNLRENDVVTRLGGDEFMVIFKKCDVHQARKVWYRIQDDIFKFNASGQFVFPVSASVGFTEYHPRKHNNVIQLIHEADAAMYEQKKTLKANRL
ncbi:GGDEF domain-containing protein [Fusibacter tunisiensis]|uniref:Diguanylate cyclase (GGDEF)-like protein n=1 Tax=Fusibacter tunisiensis TaxID=1008308 RepID=A0ABS2MQ73_9FIRM|nr:GGDEF domain-containing protein [Fusibacter tunisiensis]MBM7561555.1 diguanylate cyclase (GGDEF)-like protein [Fusibacter tunisiensis]